MFKHTKSSLILLSIVLLIIAGCQGETVTNVSGPYKGLTGTKMIEAVFASDAPITLENDPYIKGDAIDIIVELSNKHTEDIAQGNVRVRLTGDSAIPNFFSGAKEVIAPTLIGFDTEINQATPEEIDLGPLYYIGDLPAKTSKKITGQYCYQYPVKVKGFLYYTDKPLEIGTTLPTGSNPPSSVVVTSVDQQAVDVRDGQGKLRFRVTVKNVGTGNLVPSMAECFTYRGKRETEFLSIVASGAYPITCDNGGLIRLNKDTSEKIVSCEVTGINPSNLGSEPSELSLTLIGFAYEDEILPASIWLEP